MGSSSSYDKVHIDLANWPTLKTTKVCLKSPGKDPKASSAHSPGRSVPGLMRQTLQNTHILRERYRHDYLKLCIDYIYDLEVFISFSSSLLKLPIVKHALLTEILWMPILS